MPTTVERLDLEVSEYVNHLFQEGESISHAGWLLSGLKRFMPRLKKELATSQQYFVNWQRDHLPLRAVPMPWSVLKVLASAAWTARQFDIVLCLLLGFAFYLRTMEKLNLRSEDVAIRGSDIFVTLEETKTSKQFKQSLVVRNLHLANILREGLAHLPSSGVIWHFSPGKFRDSFNFLLKHVDLSHMQFSLYSLRRGGAMYAYVSSRNIEDIAIRGRWKDIRTARIYLDDARAAMLKQHLPENWPTIQREAAKVWHEFK
eukprot:Skav202293  [mRNA]  locus=scaffold3364:80637:81413:- [translate_table: standard]